MPDTKLLLSDNEIKELDKEYCSWGDTVHYHEEQTIFRNCEGSYMYDSEDTPYLDLQMWYSSCNLGYKNKRILDAVIDQYHTMPQISSRFVYDYKALLAEKIAKANLKRYGIKGRVQFNVGGAQANEDMLQRTFRSYCGYGAFCSFPLLFQMPVRKKMRKLQSLLCKTICKAF